MRTRDGTLARLLPRVAGGFGAGALVLWVLAPGQLHVLYGTETPLKPSTAICLALAGLVLGGVVTGHRVRAVLAGSVALVSAETVAAYVLHRPSVTATRLFPDAWAVGTPDGTGQMTLGAAVSLLALSMSVLARGSARVATALAVVGFTFPYVAVVGHLYGVGQLYSLQTTTGIAGLTAVAVICLALGPLLDPAMPLGRLLDSGGAGGSLTRALLPWAVLVPPAAGWLSSAMSTVLAVFVGARRVTGTDRARERAAADLEDLNAVLSERVALAVAEAEEGRERLQVLLERTPVGIFETGPDGSRRFANRRWRELAGVRTSEVGSDWTDVLHPADRDRVAALWAESVDSGREMTARYRYLRPDGTVTWVDATTTAMRGPDGEVLRWLGSVTDVTQAVESEARLAESEQRYRSVVTAMAEGVMMHDAEGVMVTANDAARRLLGLSRDELAGGTATDDRWRVVREDGTDYPADELPATVARVTGRPLHGQTMGVRRGDGSVAWLVVSSEPLFDHDRPETPTGSVTTFSDVTAARSATAALRRSEEQFRTAMAHAPIGMALLEIDGRFREVNRALCSIVGYDEAELVGMTFQQITHPDDLAADEADVARLLDGSQQHFSMEKRYLTKSGQVVWVRLAVSLARDEDDEPAYFVAQTQDITDAREAQERLEHRALHDPLTGLPNRDLLMDRLSHALLRSARGATSTVVVFCDLDRFKEVNDTHGHEAGDLLLVEMAERLRAVMRPGDTVARMGGDEFVVLAEELADADAVRGLGDRVLASLTGTVRLGDHLVTTGASVGVAVATPEDDARSVLRQADAAMYRAKALGRGRLEVGAAGAGHAAPAGHSGDRERRPA